MSKIGREKENFLLLGQLQENIRWMDLTIKHYLNWLSSGINGLNLSN